MVNEINGHLNLNIVLVIRKDKLLRVSLSSFTGHERKGFIKLIKIADKSVFCIKPEVDKTLLSSRIKILSSNVSNMS